MCQISSLMAAAEGLVAEFSSFANLEEKKRKSNLLMSFPKTANQMGSFGQIRKNSFFRFCRPILDIFGLTLLKLPTQRFFWFFSIMERVKKGSDLPKKKWGSPSFQQKYSHTKLTQRSSALYFVKFSTRCARSKMTWHARDQ